MVDSYNEIFGLGSHSGNHALQGRKRWMPLQDDAANTTVLDLSGLSADAALSGGSNTGDLAVSGPNSFLTSAFGFDGASYVLLDRLSNIINPNGDWTIGVRFRRAASANDECVLGQFRGGAGANSQIAMILENLNNPSTYGPRFSDETAVASFNQKDDDGIWHQWILRRSGNEIGFVRDGGTESTSSPGFGGDFFDANNTIGLIIGGLGSSSPTLLCSADVCDVFVFSKSMNSDELSETYNGPELINTAAPTLSGTETVGQTLSSTTGTWALDAPFSGGSNGTASYSYQWTRSDDGTGTGEANISGATSSTYTLQSADAGKFIRCFVRATNDGGFDPAADTATAFTGAISGGAAIGAAAYYYRHLMRS